MDAASASSAQTAPASRRLADEEALFSTDWTIEP
jgi:hypothetical protein